MWAPRWSRLTGTPSLAWVYSSLLLTEQGALLQWLPSSWQGDGMNYFLATFSSNLCVCINRLIFDTCISPAWLLQEKKKIAVTTATFHSNIIPCITYTEYLYLRQVHIPTCERELLLAARSGWLERSLYRNPGRYCWVFLFTVGRWRKIPYFPRAALNEHPAAF